MIFFISGGARSGKSSFAEKIASARYEKNLHSDSDSRLIYVATAKRTDREMRERINFHQEQRMVQWETVEEPYDMTQILLNSNAKDVMLIDCLTVWLSNVLYDQQDELSQVNETVFRWIEMAKAKQQTVLFVSNDLNEGVVPVANKFVQQYIYQLEQIHQYIVEHSDVAIQVIAGLPLYWKGEQL